MNHLYIGLDGGGTRTAAVALRSDGCILARAEGAGLNYLNDGLEVCLLRFRDLLSRLPSPGEHGQASVCAGLAALDGPAPEEILSRFQSVLPSGYSLRLESDLTVALAGHTLGRPGLMAVCGTGSMALVRDGAGLESCAGGWGWKIGDPGSGFALAREGLFRSALRLETEGIRTPLLTAALNFFSAPDLRSLIAPLYAPDQGPDRLAAFGARVVSLAEEGDPDALEILTRQTEQFACLSASLLKKAPEAAQRVGLSGGLFEHSALARRLFSDALRARCPEASIQPVRRPPALGAAILAMLRSGIPAEAVPAFFEEESK